MQVTIWQSLYIFVVGDNMSYPASLQKLIRELEALPGIGGRSATRIAYHLIANKDRSESISSAVLDAKNKICRCSNCRNWCEDELCDICKTPTRDKTQICVVERVSDLYAFERGGLYRGSYFVLDGVISPLDGIGPNEIGLDLLVDVCKTQNVQEIILATGSSAEGESTALYIDRLLENLPNQTIKRSRLARGIPSGTDLEYLDDTTLLRALEGRGNV